MSIEEVARIIGKAQRDVGYGAWLFEFDIDGGSILAIAFLKDVEKENEYNQNHPGVTVYGEHFLYVGLINFIDSK